MWPNGPISWCATSIRSLRMRRRELPRRRYSENSLGIPISEFWEKRAAGSRARPPVTPIPSSTSISTDAGREVSDRMPAMYRAVILLVAATLSGQWINEAARGVPRTRDGKPNLTASAPRTGGKPDLTGLWQTDTAAPGEVEKFIPGLSLNAVPGDDPTTFSKYLFNVMADYARDDVTLSPEAQKEWAANRSISDSLGPRCLPNSLPMVELFPIPKRIVQTQNLIVVLYEGDIPRQI